MRILHVISSLKIGGAEQALYALLARLSSFENHVAYFHPGPVLQKIKNLNIPTYHIRGVLRCYDPVALTRLHVLVKKIKPDVIHSSLWVANMASRLIGRMHHIPVVGDLHGNVSHEGKIRNYLDRLTAHMPAANIAVSQSVYDVYQRHIIDSIKNKRRRQRTQQKLHVIANGVDVAALQFCAQQNVLTRQSIGIVDDAFVIGSVGRLELIKSYDVLIRAFALLQQQCKKPVVLCIIGGGSQLEFLKRLAHELGVGKDVFFMGQQENPCSFYPLFDCFALSSQSEGLSIALLEALSFGLPIVSTHLSKMHDVISHATHGFLVEPNNHRELAQALFCLYSDQVLQKEMSFACLKLVENHFHINTTVDAYKKIFQEVRVLLKLKK